MKLDLNSSVLQQHFDKSELPAKGTAGLDFPSAPVPGQNFCWSYVRPARNHASGELDVTGRILAKVTDQSTQRQYVYLPVVPKVTVGVTTDPSSGKISARLVRMLPRAKIEQGQEKQGIGVLPETPFLRNATGTNPLSAKPIPTTPGATSNQELLIENQVVLPHDQIEGNTDFVPANVFHNPALFSDLVNREKDRDIKIAADVFAARTLTAKSPKFPDIDKKIATAMQRMAEKGAASREDLHYDAFKVSFPPGTQPLEGAATKFLSLHVAPGTANTECAAFGHRAGKASGAVHNLLILRDPVSGEHVLHFVTERRPPSGLKADGSEQQTLQTPAGIMDHDGTVLSLGIAEGKEEAGYHIRHAVLLTKDPVYPDPDVTSEGKGYIVGYGVKEHQEQELEAAEQLIMDPAVELPLKDFVDDQAFKLWTQKQHDEGRKVTQDVYAMRDFFIRKLAAELTEDESALI